MPLTTRSKSKDKPSVQLPGGNKRTSVNSNQHLFNEPQNPSQQTHDRSTTNMETGVDSSNSSQAETVVPDTQSGGTSSGLTGNGILAPSRNTSTPAVTTDVGQSGDPDDHGFTVNASYEGLGNTVVGDNPHEYHLWPGSEILHLRVVSQEEAYNYLQDLKVKVEWFGLELMRQDNWESISDRTGNQICERFGMLDEILRISNFDELVYDIQGVQARFEVYRTHVKTALQPSGPPSTIPSRRTSPAITSPEIDGYNTRPSFLLGNGSNIIIRPDSAESVTQRGARSFENLSLSRSVQVQNLRERLRQLTDTKCDRNEMRKQYRSATNKIAELEDCIRHQQETIRRMEEKLTNLENNVHAYQEQLESIPEMQELLMEYTAQIDDALDIFESDNGAAGCSNQYMVDGLAQTQTDLRIDIVKLSADMAQIQLKLNERNRVEKVSRRLPRHGRYQQCQSVSHVSKTQSRSPFSSTSSTSSPPLPRTCYENPPGIVPLRRSRGFYRDPNTASAHDTGLAALNGYRDDNPPINRQARYDQATGSSEHAGNQVQSSISSTTSSQRREYNRILNITQRNAGYVQGSPTGHPLQAGNPQAQEGNLHLQREPASSSSNEQTRRARRSVRNIASQCRRLRSLLEAEINNELSKSHVQDLLKMTLPFVNELKKELKKEIDNYSALPDSCVDNAIIDMGEDLMDEAHDWAIQLKNVYTAIDCGKPSLDGKLFEGLKQFTESSELSVFEFIKKFERYTADKGSKQQKAALLYDQYLDKTLQLKAVDLRHDYDGLTSWLCSHYGKPRVMCKNLLKALTSSTPPADSSVTSGLANYYRSLEAAVKRIQELKDIPEMSENMYTNWVESTDFLDLLVGKLPREAKNKFFTSMVANGKDVDTLHGIEVFELIVEIVKAKSKITEAMWKCGPEEHSRSKTKEPTSPKGSNRAHVTVVGSPQQQSPTVHVAAPSSPPKSKDNNKPKSKDKTKDGKQTTSTRPNSKCEFPCVFERHTHELGACTSFLTAGCRARQDIALGKFCLTCLKPRDICDRKCANRVPDAMKCKKCGDNPRLKHYPPRCVLFCFEDTHKDDIDVAAFTSALEGYLKGIVTGSIDGNVILEID